MPAGQHGCCCVPRYTLRCIKFQTLLALSEEPTIRQSYDVWKWSGIASAFGLLRDS